VLLELSTKQSRDEENMGQGEAPDAATVNCKSERCSAIASTGGVQQADRFGFPGFYCAQNWLYEIC
jgi:hypothetical protein